MNIFEVTAIVLAALISSPVSTLGLLIYFALKLFMLFFIKAVDERSAHAQDNF